MVHSTKCISIEFPFPKVKQNDRRPPLWIARRSNRAGKKFTSKLDFNEIWGICSNDRLNSDSAENIFFWQQTRKNRNISSLQAIFRQKYDRNFQRGVQKWQKRSKKLTGKFLLRQQQQVEFFISILSPIFPLHSGRIH